MRYYKIDLLCSQETRVPKADYFTQDGFQVLLSGKDSERCWSGAGFLLSPFLKRRVKGFLQLCDRLASIQIKAARRAINFISAYAPHKGHPYDVRSAFYKDLGTLFERCSRGGSRVFVLGDLKARIGVQTACEKEYFGPYSYGRQVQRQPELANRELLLELCIGHDVCVANTFQDSPIHQRVTFFNTEVSPLAPITESNFNMLDLLLCSRLELCGVRGLQSVRNASLATNHFLVLCGINCSFEHFENSKKTRKDFVNLNPTGRQRFVNTFCDTFQCMRESHFESSRYPDMESLHGSMSCPASSPADQDCDIHSQPGPGQSRAGTTFNAANLGVLSHWATIVDAIRAAEETLPDKRICARKRWISQRAHSGPYRTAFSCESCK